MKDYELHFDGEPFTLERMRKLLNPPVRVSLTDRILAVVMVPVIVAVIVALLSGLWLCAKAGWIEEG